jgi:8-oxo-dGTP pyrophosphatase MutT (NUDIX family)
MPRALVEQIEPHDQLEADHRDQVLTWLDRTDDIYRRRAPDVPVQHLVSYFAVVDQHDQAMLLVDHRKAGLWLPAGGHVEIGEHPWVTVQREAAEELALAATPTDRWGTDPAFVTVTRTRGPGVHTDVSLWFVLTAARADEIHFDTGEFKSIQWWSSDQLGAADPATLDPHLPRFLAKLTR